VPGFVPRVSPISPVSGQAGGRGRRCCRAGKAVKTKAAWRCGAGRRRGKRDGGGAVGYAIAAFVQRAIAARGVFARRQATGCCFTGRCGR